jgi:2-dehydro-3-deoxygalactonokinase
MIAVDWGTTAFRAVLLDAAGAPRDRVEGPWGILTVPEGGFPAALRERIGPWLAAGQRRVWMCGMVGSRQGWIEAPYLPVPASVAQLARAAMGVPFDGAEIRLVPGMMVPGQRPDVMRGEETKVAGLLGTLPAAATLCLPGTHSKWVRIADGRILHFESHMTGEVFGALRGHTILARTMPAAPHDPDAFARGVRRAREPGGLLHHVFGARALGLTGQLPDASAASYLSGLLIGHEIAAALADAAPPVHLAGGATLVPLYAAALVALDVPHVVHDVDAATEGLRAMAQSWT